jgi:DNA repair protein RecO (recombination protein O)
MEITTKAVVLNAIKYQDSSLIVRCYTESDGVKSYMLRGILKARKGKLKAAYFQPLTQLRITAKHSNKNTLNYIKEVEVIHHYNSIYKDIIKQSIALFLSEVINYSIREEESNEILYEYLETSLLWLDTHDKISNFHLFFMLNLSKYLGFYPDLSDVRFDFFDLSKGCFTERKPFSPHIFGEELNAFRKLLGINFDALNKVQYNSKTRHQLLLVLIQYFELHLSGFKKPKSLDVLKVIFS